MRNYISILLGVLLIISVKAQNSKNLVNRTPDFLKITTPNVASFNKFIDNPIGLYNGNPDVSIPVYTLKDREIELPITLRYNTSGIKVSEEASWVGLGWNLNVGGVITQNVVGDYDFYDTEYNSIIEKLNKLPSPDFTYQYDSPKLTLDFYSPFHLYTNPANQNRSGKLNPDVFYFSYPGGSGKFIIDYRNAKVYILNKEENTKIEILSKEFTDLNMGKINSFKVTTNKGIEHYFYYLTSRNHINTPANPNSVSYVLKESVYPNGQKVYYEYDTYRMLSFSRNDYFVVQPNYVENTSQTSVPYGEMYDSQIPTIYEGFEFLLKKITTSNYTISFETSDRIDIMNGKKLNSIKIEPIAKNGYETTKEFYFEYDYFQGSKQFTFWTPSYSGVPPTDAYPKWNDDFSLKRLKLNTVYERKGLTKNNKYNFYYDNTLLPSKYSYAVDYWGHFNSAGGNSFIPDIKTMTWGEAYANQIDMQTCLLFETYRFKGVANRGYDFESCQAGILKGIAYPTGGYSEFSYEPNSFISYPIPKAKEPLTLPGGEVYVNATDKNNNSSKLAYFSVENAPNGKTVEMTIQFELGLLERWYLMLGSYVRICALRAGGSPIVVSEYGIGDMGIDISGLSKEKIGRLEKKINLAEGNYYILVDIPDGLGNQDGSNTPHASAWASLRYARGGKFEKEEVQGCGLRIAKINFYNSTEKLTPLLTTEYKYQEPKTGWTSGILHDQLNYLQEYHVRNFLYAQTSIGKPVRMFSFNAIRILGSNPGNDPYGGISGVTYTFVNEIRMKKDQNEGYSIHEFYNKESRYMQGSVRLSDCMNGKLLKTEIFNKDSILVKRETNSYNQEKVLDYYGINFESYLNMFPEVYNNVHNWTVHTSEWELYHYEYFRIIMHQLNAYNITLKNKEIYQDGILTKENYIYSNTLQLIEKKITLETGNIMKYTYTYPNEYDCGIYLTMASKNMISNPIEEKIYTNDGYIGGNLTEFGYTRNGLIKPSILYFSELLSRQTSPITSYTCSGVNRNIYPAENVFYSEYDSFGNINYLVLNKSDNTVYLWSYNGQYPIAKIKNATYTEVETAVKNILGLTINALSQNKIPSEIWLKDGSLQKALPKAIVNTYTYQPLVGILTATDPNGITTYYDYDVFGNLNQVYVIESGIKKILESHTYHYQNQ